MDISIRGEFKTVSEYVHQNTSNPTLLEFKDPALFKLSITFGTSEQEKIVGARQDDRLFRQQSRRDFSLHVDPGPGASIGYRLSSHLSQTFVHDVRSNTPPQPLQQVALNLLCDDSDAY